jgi:hypothetical protein
MIMKKAHRVISIGYADYLLPEDMTCKDISELLAMLASLRRMDFTGRDIVGKWTKVHYTEGMCVSYRTDEEHSMLFDSRDQATMHLDYLEQAAAQPEIESAF